MDDPTKANPTGQEATAESERLLLDAKQAARLCGMSPASWHRLSAAGENPAAIRKARMVRWRRSDLELWVELGLPDRRTFESIAAAERRRGHR